MFLSWLMAEIDKVLLGYMLDYNYLSDVELLWLQIVLKPHLAESSEEISSQIKIKHETQKITWNVTTNMIFARRILYQIEELYLFPISSKYCLFRLICVMFGCIISGAWVSGENMERYQWNMEVFVATIKNYKMKGSLSL